MKELPKEHYALAVECIKLVERLDDEAACGVLFSALYARWILARWPLARFKEWLENSVRESTAGLDEKGLGWLTKGKPEPH